MNWYELDPSFKKYSEEASSIKFDAVTVHALLESGSRITVDTTTDWAIVLIGVGTIASAMLTALFSYLGQRQQIKASSEGLKNQVRANAANLRNVWMEQLRVVTSEFLQCSALVANKLNRDSVREADVPDIDAHRNRALLLQIKIKLYVGTSSNLASEIVTASTLIINGLNGMARRDNDVKMSDVVDLMSKLENLVVIQLEQAWNQAKGDLGFVE